MLANMSLSQIARNPSESVRPDLWPGFAYLPMMGRQGSMICDPVSLSHANLAAGTPVWDADGLVFDGSQNFIANRPVEIDTTRPWSFVFRMNTTTWSFDEEIVARVSAVEPKPSSSGLLDFGVFFGNFRVILRTNGVSSTTINSLSSGAIDDGLWHTCIYTLDYPAASQVYIDGNPIISASPADRGAYSFTQPINIGCSSWVGGLAAVYFLPYWVDNQMARDLHSDILLPLRRKLFVSFYVPVPTFRPYFQTRPQIIGAA